MFKKAAGGAATAATGALAGAMAPIIGVLVAVTLFASIVGGLTAAITAAMSSGGSVSGGGSTLAEIALAEYEAGEEDGTYHSNGEKYWRYMGYASRVAWCASFVSYCANEAGVGELKSPAAADWVGSLVDKHSDIMTRHKNDGSYTPQVGDVAVWRPSGAAYDVHGGSMSHVGIIVEVDESAKNFVTVEGNSSNKVSKNGATNRGHSWSSFTGNSPDYFVSIAGLDGSAVDLGDPIEIPDYTDRGTYTQGACLGQTRSVVYVFKQNVKRWGNLQMTSLNNGSSQRITLSDKALDLIGHGNGMACASWDNSEYLLVAPSKKYVVVLKVENCRAKLVGKIKTSVSVHAITVASSSGSTVECIVANGSKNLKRVKLDLSSMTSKTKSSITGYSKGNQDISYSKESGVEYIYAGYGGFNKKGKAGHVVKYKLSGNKLTKVWNNTIEGEPEAVIPVTGKIWVVTEGGKKSLKRKDYLVPWTLDGSDTSAGTSDSTAQLGKGETRNVPTSVKQTGIMKDYTHFDTIHWSQSCNQGKVFNLWKQKGRKNIGGIATIDGRYLLALPQVYGSAGDYVDVRLADGTVIKGIIMDEKRKTGDNGTATPEGHIKGKNGEISIVEFECIKSMAKSGKVTAWKPWLKKKVKSITNYGSALK